MTSFGTSKWPKLLCEIPFRKLVELWLALPLEHLLYDFVPICHSWTPGISFGRIDSFKLPYLYLKKHLFHEL